MSEEKAGGGEEGDRSLLNQQLKYGGWKINSGMRNRWIVSEGVVYAREAGVSY